MLDYLRRVLTQDEGKEFSADPLPPESENHEKKLQVATAALFVEIASADGDFSKDERSRIIKTMKNEFSLSDECVKDLVELSEEKVKDSISVYEFASVINDHLDKKEKLQLLKNLWRVVYTDGKLNQYEDRLIKIIGGTLNLDHKEVIGAKLKVKQELGG
jgi:uncharacterized tellurite resistance protein B-like protein